MGDASQLKQRAIPNRTKLVWKALLAALALLVVVLLWVIFFNPADDTAPGEGRPQGIQIPGEATQPSDWDRPAVNGAADGDSAEDEKDRDGDGVEVVAPEDQTSSSEVPDPPSFMADETDVAEAEDLAQVLDPVTIDFGNYVVAVGEEVEVSVQLDCPPLTELAIPLAFDNTKLRYVRDSARELDGTFKGRMEFYGRNDQGRLGLLVSGFPGMKNVEGAEQNRVMSFRMSALAAGTVDLEVLANAAHVRAVDGEPVENVQFVGGRIEIR